MPEKEHSTQNLFDRLARWQSKLRKITSLVPTRQLPLLTSPEGFGSDIERFRNQSQALVTWRDKQTQIWTVCGHLRTSKNRPYAFALSFHERHLQNDFLGAVPARWVLPVAFSSNFTFFDPMNAKADLVFRSWQKGGLPFNAVLGKCGYSSNERVHLEYDGWSFFAEDASRFQLSAQAHHDSLHLSLTSLKPLVYHGQDGFNQNSASQNAFVCSLPRLEIKGRAVIAGELEEVTGLGWLEHEKFSARGLPPESGVERLKLQFETGDDLILFLGPRFATGTWIAADGATKHLISSDIAVTTSEHWISPVTGARYPIKRQVSIEALGLSLELRAPKKEQETDARKNLGGVFWSGSLNVEARIKGRETAATCFSVAAGTDRRPLSRAVSFLTS